MFPDKLIASRQRLHTVRRIHQDVMHIGNIVRRLTNAAWPGPMRDPNRFYGLWKLVICVLYAR